MKNTNLGKVITTKEPTYYGRFPVGMLQTLHIIREVNARRWTMVVSPSDLHTTTQVHKF